MVSTALSDHNSDAVRAQPRARLSLEHSRARADAPVRSGSRRLHMPHTTRPAGCMQGQLAACEAGALPKRAELRKEDGADCCLPAGQPEDKVKDATASGGERGAHQRWRGPGEGPPQPRARRSRPRPACRSSGRTPRCARAPRPRSRADTRRCTPRTRTASPGRRGHFGRKMAPMSARLLCKSLRDGRQWQSMTV